MDMRSASIQSRLHKKTVAYLNKPYRHTRLDAEPVDRWSREMSGMRRTLQALSNIPSEKIRGIRAPLLAVGGDNQFEMMVE